MQTKKQKFVTIATAILLLTPLQVTAQSTSPNYMVDETFFGTGGEVDMSSPNFRGQGSAGSLGVGSSSSNNFDAESGFMTPDEPFLEMVINNTEVDLGLLSASATASNSTTFSIRTYMSNSYAVLTLSQPPTNESGTPLAGMTGAAAPTVGKEEFGMNLVANTNPSIGANPVNQPDSSFADGGAAAGYNVPNIFKYAVGDTIAAAPANPGNPAVGLTTYTISYIANISSITEAGLYSMAHELVAVATY